mgnify:CR=1 FL=1
MEELKGLKTENITYIEKSNFLATVQKELNKKNIRHLIRYSGTENKLRILLEGKDSKEMNSCMEIMVKFFEKELNA